MSHIIRFQNALFLFVAKDAWTELITHEGEWDAEIDFRFSKF